MVVIDHVEKIAKASAVVRTAEKAEPVKDKDDTKKGRKTKEEE